MDKWYERIGFWNVYGCHIYVFDWEVNLFDLAQEPRGSKLDKGKEKSDRRAVVIVRQLPR